MRLLTQPDFIRKSKQPIVLNVENTEEIKEHIGWLKNYHQNLITALGEYRVEKKYEQARHGNGHHKIQGLYRTFGYRQRNRLTFEIQRMENEINRLNQLL